jgi:hypothetical protein
MACAFDAPSSAGDAHPVADQVAAGAFDDAGGDPPAFGQGPRVVQVGLLVVQVGQGALTQHQRLVSEISAFLTTTS